MKNSTKCILAAICMAVSVLPALAQDTLFSQKGILAIGSAAKVGWHSVSYIEPGDSSLRSVPKNEVYFIHFADGRTWPKWGLREREARLRHNLAKAARLQNTPPRDYKSERHRILVCAPGLHQTGEFPGISFGLSYDGFFDARRRFSAGFSLTHVWAGTNEAGKLHNGDHRTNIKLACFSPHIRYHPVGGRSVLDPFVGIGVVTGNYRRSASWMKDGRMNIELPANHLLVAPQLELGLSINPVKAFTLQLAAGIGPQFIDGNSSGSFGSVSALRIGFRF